MATRAKFRCTETTKRAGGSQYHPVTDDQIAMQQVEVVLVAAKTTDDDNVDWSRWTPSGEIRMTITNPEAFRQFDVDVDYIVEFRKAQPQKARTSGEED